MVQRACHPAPAPDLALAARESEGLLAPAWHTRALVAWLLAVAVAGSLLDPAFLPAPSTRALGVRAYVPLLLVNVMLCVYASGVGLRRNLLARWWVRPLAQRRRWPADLAIGVGLALALVAAESGLQRLLGLPESLAAHSLMPRSVGEKVTWVWVAAFVGFAEELVYRGYLQRQLTALSGWLPLGLVAQALLFGIAHAEQGSAAVARFAVYGGGLGLVAAWRRSLLPTVVAHVLVDWLAAAGG